MTKIEAVLLDLDGTLRDTQDAIYDSIQYALKDRTGKLFSRADMKPYIHHHTEVYKGLVGEAGLAEFDDVYSARVEKLVLRSPLFAGVEQLLTTLRRTGYRLALVSSARRGEAYLLQHNIKDYFEVIVGANDVRNLKPHPEPVEVALSRLGLRAEAAVMVGDMTADLDASRSAGVPHRIGITHGFGGRQELLSAGATGIIDTLADLPPLLERLSGS